MDIWSPLLKHTLTAVNAATRFKYLTASSPQLKEKFSAYLVTTLMNIMKIMPKVLVTASMYSNCELVKKLITFFMFSSIFFI
jgi:hypothetical protein